MEANLSISRTCALQYEDIAALLKKDPGQALRAPAESAVARASQAVVHLHTGFGWFDHDENVTATIGHYEAVGSGRGRVNLSWRADRRKRLLPNVDGHLEIAQVAASMSEIRYVGHYQAPFGILGRIEDATIGHRIVEDAIGQLLDDTISHLKEHLMASL